MASLLATIAFFSVAFAFGYCVSVLALNEKRMFVLAPLSALIGINGYLFLVNVLSYVIPIRTTFWLVFLLLLATTSFLFCWRRVRRPGLTRGLTKRQLIALFATAFAVSAFSSLVVIHSIEADEYSLTHLSLATTISEGNFPVLDPSSPDHVMPYHYSAELLSAALHNLTGLPFWIAYDLEIFVFSGLAILMAFVLGYELAGRFRNAWIASMLFFYGGGLAWLNVVNGFDPLWKRFVLHQQVAAPWSFFAWVVSPRLATPYSYAIDNFTTAIGTPLILLVLYLFLAYLARGDVRKWISATIIATLSFGMIALSLETHFLILATAFLLVLVGGAIALVIRRFGKMRRLKIPGRMFAALAAILVVGSFIAFFQGGILTSLLFSKGNLGPSTYVINFRFWIIHLYGATIPLFSWTFVQDFGVPLLLVIPAVWHFRKEPRILFVALVGFGAFVTPLAVVNQAWPNELRRLYYLSDPIFAFIVGLYLSRFLPGRGEDGTRRPLSLKAKFAIVGMALIVSQGLLINAVYSVSPLGQLGKLRSPYIATTPVPSTLDQAAYGWIRDHTTLKDRFFPYSTDFIRDVGRFTPGPFYPAWGDPEETRAYSDIVASCDAKSVKRLGITYFYVNGDFPMNLDACSSLHLQPVFEVRSGDDYRGIFAVN